MSKLWKRKYNPTTKQVELTEVELEKVKVNSPTVVFLTGFSTINAQKGYIAGAIKRMEEMLGLDPKTNDKVNIFAWSHKSFKNLFNMVAYNVRPSKYASQSAKRIAQNIILPMVAKDIEFDKKGNLIAGVPLPSSEAKANLKNLTLFGYSAGTVLAQEVYNAAFKSMREIGYKEDKAKEVLHNIVLISVGNMSRPLKEKNRFSTIYMAATNDRLIRAKNRLSLSIKEMFTHYSRKLKILFLSKTSLHITAPVKNNMCEWKKTKEGTWIQKKIDLLYPKWLPRRSYHELPHYTTYEEKNNKFSKIAIYALNNAVKREEAPVKLEKLLEPTTPLAGAKFPPNFKENHTEYKNRISKAMCK